MGVVSPEDNLANKVQQPCLSPPQVVHLAGEDKNEDD
jgi:hypothetical protein